MNEVNAIVTTEVGLDGSSVLEAGREAGGQQDAGFTSSPPLAGQRSGPANAERRRPDGEGGLKQ